MPQSTLAKQPPQTTLPDAALLKKMIARFAPTELKVDTSKLSASDQKALEKLIQASRIFDDIFMDQLWSKNRATYAQLKKDQSPLGLLLLIISQVQFRRHPVKHLAAVPLAVLRRRLRLLIGKYLG